MLISKQITQNLWRKKTSHLYSTKLTPEAWLRSPDFLPWICPIPTGWEVETITAPTTTTTKCPEFGGMGCDGTKAILEGWGLLHTFRCLFPLIHISFTSRSVVAGEVYRRKGKTFIPIFHINTCMKIYYVLFPICENICAVYMVCRITFTFWPLPYLVVQTLKERCNWILKCNCFLGR